MHEKLEENWPGVPIPTLPSKRRMGNNMESKFVNQRRHYLEQYLKKLSAFDYLIESTEFNFFSRPKTADIEKSFKAHKKPTY